MDQAKQTRAEQMAVLRGRQYRLEDRIAEIEEHKGPFTNDLREKKLTLRLELQAVREAIQNIEASCDAVRDHMFGGGG